MRLDETNLTTTQIANLNKKNIQSVDGLLYTEPIRYSYYDKTYPLTLTSELESKIQNKVLIAIMGVCTQVEYEYKRQTKKCLLQR